MKNDVYKIVNGAKVLVSNSEQTVINDYKSRGNSVNEQRLIEYGDLGAQLDMIWHELDQTGKISKTGAWYQHVQKVKLNNIKI